MKQVNNKRGFTIVECVVAMAIVTIVSATAFMIYMSAERSIGDRWDKFRATVFGNNLLSFFQAADDMNTFTSFMEDGLLTHSRKEEDSNTVTLSGLDYQEYDPVNQTIPVAFSTVKADKMNTTVTFYSDSTEMMKFDYKGDSTTFKADAQAFNDDTLYKLDKQIGVTYSVTYSTQNGKNIGYKITNGKTTLSKIGDSIVDVEYDTNAFEQYLYDKGYYIVLTAFESYLSGTTRYCEADFAVYDINTGNPVPYKTGNLMYHVYAKSKRGWDVSLKWSDDHTKAGDDVQNIKVYSSNESSDNRVVDSTLEIPQNFEWHSFLFMFYGESISSMNATAYSKDSTADIYTVNGGETASALAYALRTSSGVELYNAASNDGELLFTYTLGGGSEFSDFVNSKPTFTKFRTYDSDTSNVHLLGSGDTVLQTFKYGSDSEAAADVNASLKTDKYTATTTEKKKKTIGYTTSGMTLTVTQLSDEYTVKVEYDGDSVERDATTLEKDLFDQGYVLFCDPENGYVDSYGTVYIYFTVYSANGQVKSGNNGLYIRVKSTDYDDYGSWDADDMSFTISEVKSCYAKNLSKAKSSKSYGNYNNKTYSSFTWTGYPCFICDMEYDGNSFTAPSKATVTETVVDKYTDYTLKSGTSRIGSMSEDETGYTFYNTDSTPVELYHYTTSSGNLATLIKMIKTVFPNERNIERGDNTYLQYFKPGDPIDITIVTFDDANLQIKFGTPQKNDNVVFKYTKGTAEENLANYENDKAKITSKYGEYYSCYDNPDSATVYPLHDYREEAVAFSGLEDMTISPKLDVCTDADNNETVSVVMRGDKIPDGQSQFYQVIFCSSTAVVYATEKTMKEVELDSLSVDSQETFSVGYVKNYYSSKFGNFACFAEVVYSYSTDEEDVGVGCTPHIIVWVIPTKELPVFSGDSDLDDAARNQIAYIESTYKPAVKYYKG